MLNLTYYTLLQKQAELGRIEAVAEIDIQKIEIEALKVLI